MGQSWGQVGGITRWQFVKYTNRHCTAGGRETGPRIPGDLHCGPLYKALLNLFVTYFLNLKLIFTLDAYLNFVFRSGLFFRKGLYSFKVNIINFQSNFVDFS